MAGPRIVIVGGGSNAWTPNIVKDMLLTGSLANATFVLYDINRAASDLTAAFLLKLGGELGLKPRIISTDNRARAFRGGDYFVITISTGGLNAMARDLAIPERFGILHTVGDTSGPGGWSRLIRNFEIFVDLARDFNRYAPGAVVLNYTNPMSTLTDVLGRLCRGPVVGLCHGLFENLAFLKDFYRLESEEDVCIQYGGLNHFFWITEARAGDTDVLADLTRRLRRRSFTDLLRVAHADAMGFKSNREVATELFRLTGTMPYLGDRHTCEFFPWYISSARKMRKYKLVRTTVAERRAALRERDRRLRRMVAGTIPPAYHERSRETAADIIDAHLGGRAFIDVGNLPNRGQISNLPAGAVVETAVRVDRNGFTPLTFGALPEPVLSLVEPWTRVYLQTVEACFNHDTRQALQALRLDPTCAHLDGDDLERMGRQLLRAHRRWVTLA